MTKIDTTIIGKFEQEGLTAGQKAKLWMDIFPSDVVNVFLEKTLSLYDNYTEKNLFPKNPFFPEILNHLYSTNHELALLFVKEFFPEHVYQAFLRSEKLTPLH